MTRERLIPINFRVDEETLQILEAARNRYLALYGVKPSRATLFTTLLKRPELIQAILMEKGEKDESI